MMKRIHVVREAGGLGDVIRIFPALDGLRKKWPETKITYHGPWKYQGQVMWGHCWGMDRPGCEYASFEGEMARTFRPYRGAALPGGMWRNEKVIDLYGPAWQHEFEERGNVTMERSQIFCQAARVDWRPPCFKLSPVELDLSQRERKGVIGLHARSRALIRNWQAGRWKELRERLKAAGHRVEWIDDPPDGVEAGDRVYRGLAWGVLAAVVKSMRVVIGVDSGIFHLAGALGVPVVGLFGSSRGDIISRIYRSARYIQAPRAYGCAGACYGKNERGFDGGRCLEGCQDLAAVEVDEVMGKVEEMLR